MNPAIRTCQSPLPVALGRLPSGSRVHVCLSHGSLSVSQSSKGSHLVSRPSYVKCTVEAERFSEGSRIKENWKKNNIVRGAGRASLVLACVLGAFTLSGKMNPKANLAYAAPTQDPCQGPVLSLRKSIFKTQFVSDNEIENLKLYAMSLSLNRCKGAAEEIMRYERESWKGTAISHQLTVALIELLLYQEKYQEAKKIIQDLMEDIKNNDGVFDVPKEKVYFLKAVAESATDKAKAESSWAQYHDALQTSPRAARK